MTQFRSDHSKCISPRLLGRPGALGLLCLSLGSLLGCDTKSGRETGHDLGGNGNKWIAHGAQSSATASALAGIGTEGKPESVPSDGFDGDTQRQFTDTTARQLPAQRHAAAFALGDVDGDGDLDLVRAKKYQSHLYVNGGTGTFEDVTASRLPPDWTLGEDVALGDVDGDGDLDIVFSRSPVYFNDGTGTFTVSNRSELNWDTGQNCWSVALGDLDGDGDLDLVFGNKGQNFLYSNDGVGRFKNVTWSQLPADSDWTWSVGLGDVDGDGDLDLVFGNKGQNRLYLNDGGGVFADVTAGRLPLDAGETAAVALGDVDADGDLDLMMGNADIQSRLCLNDGSGFFVDATASKLPEDDGGTWALELGDADLDGDLDLFLCDGDREGRPRLYVNDGTGAFVDSTRSRLPLDMGMATEIALGDIDGDGDQDMILGGANSEDRLLTNYHTQVETPLVPVRSLPFRMQFHVEPGYGTSDHIAIPAVNLALAPSPVAIPTLGKFYLELNGLILLPPVVIPASTGMGEVSVTVPSDPSLAGQTVYVQALIFKTDPMSAMALTGYTADLIR